MLYSCTHMAILGVKMFQFKCMKWKQITRHKKMNYGRCEQTIISNKQQFIRQKRFSSKINRNCTKRRMQNGGVTLNPETVTFGGLTDVPRHS